MKRTATCCIIALFLASCQKSAVTPERPLAAPGSKNLASVTSAAPFQTQDDIDISSLGLQVSTCTGEPLQVVSGEYHVDMHGLVNGNKLSITQHTNAQDFKLVGLISGATYTGSTTSNQTYNPSLVNGKFTTTETETVLMTTPGGKNNSLLRFDVHETFDAQGQLTANIDNFRFGCK